MQAYYWWFKARERFEARQARQREQEFRRAAELAALRAGEEEAHVEAAIGAVVPAEQLPAEPALAELPVDPVLAGEAAAGRSPAVAATAARRRSSASRTRAPRRATIGRTRCARAW